MKIIPLSLDGLYRLAPEPFQDERGMFARIFCLRELATAGLSKPVVQANHSVNRVAGAIRGMHFQFSPKAETKIVKCLCGSVFDVAVDIRRTSPTFLHWHGEVLSGSNMYAMLIPPGFAHGFQVLEPDSELLYLHTEYFSPDFERGILHNEPRVGIAWPLPVAMLSERDASHPALDDVFEGIDG